MEPTVTPAVVQFLVARDAVWFVGSSSTHRNLTDIRAALKYPVVPTGLASRVRFGSPAHAAQALDDGPGCMDPP